MAVQLKASLILNICVWSGHSSMYIIHFWCLGLLNVGLVKWSLKMTRSAEDASIRLLVIAHALTGHFSLRKAPLPGRMFPQELTPFHKRIFFSGVVESS